MTFSIEIWVPIAIVTLVTLFAFAKLARNRASLLAWFLFFSVAFVNIAAIYNVLTGYVTPGGLEALWVTTIGLLSVLCGGLLVGSMFALIKTPNVASERKTVDGARILYVMALGILGPAWLYFLQLGYVPLFDALKAYVDGGVSSLGTLHQSRLSRDSYASSSGVYIPFQGALELFRNFGAAVIFVYADRLRQNGLKGRGLIIIMALSLLTCLAAGQRWPLMYLMIATLLSRAVVNTRLPLSRVLQWGVLAIAAGATLSAFQARTQATLNSMFEALAFGVGDVLNRIVIAQTIVPLQSYEILDRVHAHMQEPSYITSFKALAPGEGDSFPVMFYQWVTGDSLGFTAPPDAYTEAYLNAGALGVVAVSLIMGAAVQWLESVLLKYAGNPFYSANFSVLAAALLLAASTGPMFVIGAAIVFVYAGVGYFLLQYFAKPEGSQYDSARATQYP